MGRQCTSPLKFTEEEKRGKGRPKKPEGQINLNRPRSSVKYDVRYAENTIKKAETIYKSYESGRPNPLNIAVKDLCKEARITWEYIYSMRDLDLRDLEHNMAANGGRYSRAFANADEVIFAWESFCEYIRNCDFVKKVKRVDGTEGVLPLIPNQTSFSRWLGIQNSIITRCMDAHAEPRHYATYKRLLADLISEGAMMGIYQNTMSIFTLKNMCDWADKFEDRPKQETDTLQTLEEAKELINKLGLNATKLLGGAEDGQADTGTPDD